MSLVSIIPTCHIKQCLLLQVDNLKTAHRVGFLLVSIIGQITTSSQMADKWLPYIFLELADVYFVKFNSNTFSRFALSSNSCNIQFADGETESSSLRRVASTRLATTDKLRCCDQCFT